MATQLPAPPALGSVWNYAGQNYVVVDHNDNFVCLGADNRWHPAIGLTDHVGEGESAEVAYVMPLETFTRFFNQGEIEEGAEAGQLPAGGPEIPTTKPVEPDEPEAAPKG